MAVSGRGQCQSCGAKIELAPVHAELWFALVVGAILAILFSPLWWFRAVIVTVLLIGAAAAILFGSPVRKASNGI